MTVDEMPAGREIDVLADEKVMEKSHAAERHRNICARKTSDKPEFCEGPVYEESNIVYHHCGLPSYSTRLEEAWKLMDKIPGTGYLYKNYEGKYQATTHSATMDGHAGFLYMAMADTPALAIVRVALKRMGVK